jgi:hypothetical protein
MTLPNFLIIGAMKSGTSSLHQYLRTHPQIFMPARKELHFFTAEQLPWQAGLQSLNIEAAQTHPILQLYSQFFNDAVAQIAIGEATTTYLHHPPVAQRIYQYLPKMKLICILRNPIDRAYSHFHHQLRRGEESRLTFQEILHSDPMQCSEGYIRLGYYHRYLSHYSVQFPSDQIKILLFEDLLHNQAQSLNQILDFLEVERQQPNPELPHTNPGWSPAFPKLNQCLIAQNPLIPILKLLSPQKARITRLPPRIRQFIIKQLGQKAIAPLSPVDRSQAYKLFQDDIQALELLLNKDLSVWHPSRETSDMNAK